MGENDQDRRTGTLVGTIFKIRWFQAIIGITAGIACYWSIGEGIGYYREGNPGAGMACYLAALGWGTLAINRLLAAAFYFTIKRTSVSEPKEPLRHGVEPPAIGANPTRGHQATNNVHKPQDGMRHIGAAASCIGCTQFDMELKRTAVCAGCAWYPSPVLAVPRSLYMITTGPIHDTVQRHTMPDYLHGDIPAGRREPPNYKLYKTRGIVLAAFVGSIPAGGILLAKNFWHQGELDAAKNAVVLSFIALIVTFMLGAIAVMITPIPAYACTFASLYLLGSASLRLQGYRLSEHVRQGGKLESNWKALGMALLFMVGLIAILNLSVVLWPHPSPG